MIVRTDKPILQDADSLTHTVAAFWDQISAAWQTIWGPHIHHGYYEANESLTPLQAQERLLEKLILLFPIKSGQQVLDVGCGMGGTSLFLAERYQANVTGISLSQKQVSMATTAAKQKKLSRVYFCVENALTMRSIADNSFDVVWSLESCEQFFDKPAFLQQAHRVLKPGGRLMLATWCSGKDEYTGSAAKLYQKLCHAFDVPYMPTLTYYRQALASAQFEIKQVQDWSLQVRKSWEQGLTLVNAYSFLKLIKMAGWRGWRFSRQIKLMHQGFESHQVKYGVFVAEKH